MYAPGYAPGQYGSGHALDLGTTVTAEPSRGARTPAAAGRANWGAGFTRNCAGRADWQSGKLPLDSDMPTGSAEPARGATPGGAT